MKNKQKKVNIDVSSEDEDDKKVEQKGEYDGYCNLFKEKFRKYQEFIKNIEYEEDKSASV